MNKRVEWIDIARGIGIILVVLGHSVTTVIRENSSIAMSIYTTVYFFHLPLLFFVSGLAFDLSTDKYEKQAFKKYFGSKCKRLMLPYVMYSFLVYLIFSIANLIPKVGSVLAKMSYGKLSFLSWLRGLVIGNNIYSEHLWYLYSLFVLSAMAFILLKLTGKKYKFILLVITIIMWFFLRMSSEYDVIWKTSYRGIWFALGCAAGVKRSYSKTEKGIILIIGALIFGFNSFLWGLMENIVPIYIYDIFKIAVLMYIFVVVSQIFEELGDKLIKWLGENSMCIYLFHQPFLGSGLGVVLFSILHLPVAVCIVVSLIACIVIPILIGELLKRPWLKVLRLLLLGG